MHKGLNMANPYFNRSTIRDPRYFYGRKKELQRIFSLIGSTTPQCVSIIGERRIGKSTLLYHIKESSTIQTYLNTPKNNLFI